MKKKLAILIPLAAVLICAGALGIYYMSEGYGGLVSLFAAVDRTDMMRAEEYRNEDGTVLPYRIYVPEGDDPQVKYPLVLFLHGSGERGDDNRAQTKKNSVMQTLLSEENLAKYPCVVLAPQCPAGQSWAGNDPDNAGVLMGLLEQTKAAYSVDDGRVYITGISMGGFGTFGMLAAYPDYFAAAVPICGGWDPEDAALMKDVPVWVFHGARDKAVDPQNSRDMVRALEDAGGYVKYTEYPRERHQSWEKAYREPALFSWMFGCLRGN